eukprot:5964395-Pleurochrysis_carterae.AAC.1
MCAGVRARACARVRACAAAQRLRRDALVLDVVEGGVEGGKVRVVDRRWARDNLGRAAVGVAQLARARGKVCVGGESWTAAVAVAAVAAVAAAAAAAVGGWRLAVG